MQDTAKIQNFDEISLLGVRFHKLNVRDLINYIVKSAKTTSKTVVGNVNVRAINFAYELPWYRDFINNKSDVVFCDGFGVLLGAKMCGHSVDSHNRMTCPDYIEDLALACERENVSLFLLAGKPGTVDKAITKLKALAPKLEIKGHHGYFEKSGEENEFVIAEINQFKPDILYVGFGMPLQERWIVNNFDHLDTKVILPLGACLDFYTGNVYRGPRWMTNLGLEWLTRLLTEPSRLSNRYLVGNPLFFYRLFQERIRQFFKKPSKKFLG